MERMRSSSVFENITRDMTVVRQHKIVFCQFSSCAYFPLTYSFYPHYLLTHHSFQKKEECFLSRKCKIVENPKIHRSELMQLKQRTKTARLTVETMNYQWKTICRDNRR
ncbi:hypothetical protein ILYODFUR_034024 [Ilyodon furcidens]|uniref:Uncharacterized protein n=1 Tax=Ilyodon furcidens TaxID=33524 RepID=A0ABV0T2N1_9TELE